jgi:hypothetical protein
MAFYEEDMLAVFPGSMNIPLANSHKFANYALNNTGGRELNFAPGSFSPR